MKISHLPPDNLIKSNLSGNLLGLGSLDFLVEPVVEVVSRRSVIQESESRKSNESLPVESSSSDKDLM